MADRSRRPRPKQVVPRPDRVRALEGIRFGWIDARLFFEGWLERLDAEALSVYAFLCLVADREGVSFYGRRRMASALGIHGDALRAALSLLVRLGLVAFAPFAEGASEGYYQVLSLPSGGPPPHPLRPLFERLVERFHVGGEGTR
jgi:hypothetical protein